MKVSRVLKHALVPAWTARRPFSSSVLQSITEAIKKSELQHDGELRFVIEGPLPFAYLFRPKPARVRAEDLFAQLRVWDTEHNSGVLIYVQLVDRRIEIVADRGIARRVAQDEWDGICRAMENEFKKGNYEAGALQAIDAVTRILEREFPAGPVNPDELPDQPAVL